MEKLSLFAQAVRDGEHFLARHHFLLAKRSFEAALTVQETPELLEKVALCVRGIVQRGDQLAHEGRWPEALLYLEKIAGGSTTETALPGVAIGGAEGVGQPAKGKCAAGEANRGEVADGGSAAGEIFSDASARDASAPGAMRVGEHDVGGSAAGARLVDGGVSGESLGSGGGLGDVATVEMAEIAARKETLRHKIAQAALHKKMTSMEQNGDRDARMAVYDHILDLYPHSDAFTQEVRAKKAFCWLQSGHDAEVVALYTDHPPGSDSGRYYAGMAHARRGHYCAALTHWAGMTHWDPALEQHALALMPFVLRTVQALPVGPVHLSAYQDMHRFFSTVSDASGWRPYVAPLRRMALTFLWQADRFLEMPALLPPLSQTLSLPLLGLHARLYFRLAERDVQFLEQAMALWLTAIHQDPLLDDLYARRQAPTVGRAELREKLWQRMVHLVAHHGPLPPGLQAVWQREKEMVRRLAAWPDGEGRPDIFPCTPGFAVWSQQAGGVLAFLQAHPPVPEEAGEGFLALCACFSPWGETLMRMEGVETDREPMGEKRIAMPSGALADYCRQRMHWHVGLRNLQSGGRSVAEHLRKAAPLITRYPAYAETLAEWAFDDLEKVACVELAEVLERLSPHVRSRRFREAVAHLMGLKASYLYVQDSGVATDILDRAAALCPRSVMVRTVRAHVRRHRTFERLTDALRHNRLLGAVQLLHADPDPEPRAHFFDTMAQWSADVEAWEATVRQDALHDMHEACCQLEPEHSVTQALAEKIQRGVSP